MNLLLLGVSHHTAGVALREQLSAAAGDACAWLTRVGRQPDVAEVCVLATCHRFEVLVATPDVEAARAALHATLGAVWSEASPYAREGSDAVAHLARVACGLDSLIVGEAEIAGQIRRAAAIAREAGTMGPYLEAAVAGALGASGRAREETGIARGVQSAASAAIGLAQALRGSLDDAAVLVVGAGQTGRLALARAARAPHRALQIASRSGHHAQDAAAATGATAHALSEVPSLLCGADVVIAAVNGGGPLLAGIHVRAAMAARPDRPLILIDLSVPRVIAADAAAVPGVRLCSVDDLGDVVRQSAHRRAREIPRVEAIIADESRRAWQRITARRLRPAGMRPA